MVMASGGMNVTSISTIRVVSQNGHRWRDTSSSGILPRAADEQGRAHRRRHLGMATASNTISASVTVAGRCPVKLDLR
jgi:hypothetical protein